jgi:hypothetical protein
MTEANNDQSVWDSSARDNNIESVSRLSRMVAGNDHLVTQPGLVQALFQSNATPEQAQGLNQFLAGLEAEQMVRSATGKINLSQDQQDALTSMGIPFQHVLYTQQDALTDLKSQMAAQGKQPVLDEAGNVQTDAAGNPLVENVKKDSGGGRGFFGTIGHGLAAPFKAVGKEGSALYHGRLYPGAFRVDDIQHDAVDGPVGVQGVTQDLTMGYNWTMATLESSNPLKPHFFDTGNQNADLARRLGYDPDSFLSMQAFKARGYEHNDTSSAAKTWDDAHPNGQYGWGGGQAVIEAETYAADPKKYMDSITKSGTPDEVAAKIQAVSSEDFQDLVKRVNGSKADIGTDVARGIGLDPVAHSTTFNVTAAGTNLAAQFALDPLAFGLGAFQAYQRSTVAIKGLHDAEGITRILKPEDLGHTSVAQRRTIFNLRDMVDKTNDLRAADEAGDTVKAAQIHASIQTNPFAGLLDDFTGKNQIVGLRPEEELLNLKQGELPFRYGNAEPIDTFDTAVDHMASWAAMLRLQGGYAPIETSVMPGALSSYGFLRLKGRLSAWSAGRSLSKLEAASAQFATRLAQADPTRIKKVLDDRLLLRTVPGADDAVDVLSGKVIAAERAARVAETPEDVAAAETGLASARRGLADAISKSDAPLLVDDAMTGYLRGNQLRYGRLAEAPKTALGKVASIYTLGTVQRAKLTAARVSNWTTRDDYLDIDSAASADAVRKMARTYMSSGHANMIAMRWATGNAETRKTIAMGLKDQIGHAAGLPRTEAGRRMMDDWHAQQEKYLVLGDEFIDSNGIPAAMFPGQMETRFRLPSFGTVHRAAAKIGLYEATMGRLLTSTSVDLMLLPLWKMWALLTPVTASRANLEGWLNAGAEGVFKPGVQAKAVLRDAEKLSGADIARSTGVDKILSVAPLQAAGRLYRDLILRHMPEDEAKEIVNLPDDLFHIFIHEQQAGHFAMTIDPGGVGRATEIAQDGLRAVRVGYDSPQAFDKALRSRKGFEITHEVESIEGANAYAYNLAIKVKDADVARALIARVRGAADEPDDLVKALENSSVMRHSLFGKVFIDAAGKQQKAVTDAEIALGKEQWADKITADFQHLVTGQNGVVQGKILEHVLEHGKAPDADWILKNVKGMNRPESLLRPIIDAVPPVTDPVEKFRDGFIGHLLEPSGKMYRWMVERLIQRHSTSPLFAAAYGKSKVELNTLKQVLIDEAGISEPAAERTAAVMAADQAWSRIARMVDDPHLKSQMDVVGRSFFAFSRATTMMLRRWGSTFWRNPQQARRFMLAAEGAVHSGLVYKDPSTGDWKFHFPASGVGQEVLFHAMSHIPGLRGLAEFPTSDFTGRVASTIPGSSNPFQYSTTPMVSIAGRKIAALFPEHRQWFDEIDRKLNGDAGQGRGIVATLTPRLMKQFLDPIKNDRDSITASAMVGSLYNLYAAGMVPPDGASPSDLDEFLGRLKTQTKSQLYLRAIFGVFSPATVSLPENENAASRPDFAFVALGAQGLRDEFKLILGETDGDFTRATAIWTALHPDLTVYTQSGSQSAHSGAIMPATEAALGWMTKNIGFLNKYESVAAYFIPEQSAGDEFSMAAYRAQLEEGLRVRKTPAEFLAGVRVSSAATVFYAMEDKYQADLVSAKAAGDEGLVAQHRADWEAWSKDFKAAHPSFAEHTEASAANVVNAKGSFADLKSMVKNGDVPSGLAPAVSGMVQAYDNYEQFVRMNPGSTSQAEAARSAAFGVLQDYLTETVAAAPGLTDLYNAVFRPLAGYNLDLIPG